MRAAAPAAARPSGRELGRAPACRLEGALADDRSSRSSAVSTAQSVGLGRDAAAPRGPRCPRGRASVLLGIVLEHAAWCARSSCARRATRTAGRPADRPWARLEPDARGPRSRACGRRPSARAAAALEAARFAGVRGPGRSRASTARPRLARSCPRAPRSGASRCRSGPTRRRGRARGRARGGRGPRPRPKVEPRRSGRRLGTRGHGSARSRASLVACARARRRMLRRDPAPAASRPAGCCSSSRDERAPAARVIRPELVPVLPAGSAPRRRRLSGTSLERLVVAPRAAPFSSSKGLANEHPASSPPVSATAPRPRPAHSPGLQAVRSEALRWSSPDAVRSSSRRSREPPTRTGDRDGTARARSGEPRTAIARLPR